MQAYQGYVENGRVIPFGNPLLPDGRSVIITVLDENVSPATRADRRLLFCLLPGPNKQRHQGLFASDQDTNPRCSPLIALADTK